MTEVDPVARPETAIIATQPVTLGSTHHNMMNDDEGSRLTFKAGRSLLLMPARR